MPDPEQIRMNADRRGNRALQPGDDLSNTEYLNKLRMLSLRYVADFEVLLVPKGKKKSSGTKGQDGRYFGYRPAA
ncbi:glycosyl transferase family 2 [Paenibacillus vortex V453]|uniref:Glycosyl transferase family 2 n=1 Tax=Paenibacillus vortex V453 TaxID=715225 RepID=A0A2R9SWN1_9BACL|nr:glycosyl transferase family 2 [Paenibacillus vortex V453]